MRGMKLVAGLMAVGLGCVIPRTANATGVVAASAGFADDTSLVSCWHHDFQDPGRVTWDGCNGFTVAWWDVPLTVTSTGSKTLSVYMKYIEAGALRGECDAFVLAGDGTISRWTSVPVAAEEQWIQFDALQVNANETMEVSCEVEDIAGAYISAVKGF